jgi:nuclear pore complex protein Nup188
MEMALYLEFCILKICGRSPVLWRVEEFLKEVKLLSKGNSPFILLTIF